MNVVGAANAEALAARVQPRAASAVPIRFIERLLLIEEGGSYAVLFDSTISMQPLEERQRKIGGRVGRFEAVRHARPSLEPEQPQLGRDPSGRREASAAATGREHSVARHDDRTGVTSKRLSDRAGSARIAAERSHFPVGARMAR